MGHVTDAERAAADERRGRSACSQGNGAPPAPSRTRVGRSGVQRRRRQRLPRRGGRRGLGRPRPVGDRRQPELSRRRHRDLALRIARDFSPPSRVHRHRARWTRPRAPPTPPDRCYHCKQELFGRLTALARDRGFAAVVDGNNADDRGDYRPGREAARQHGVRSPLDEAGLTKAEIRQIVPPARPADLGRTGVGLPVFPHPLRTRSDRRQAQDDRAGRGGAAVARDSPLPRAAPRRRGAPGRFGEDMARALSADVRARW